MDLKMPIVFQVFLYVVVASYSCSSVFCAVKIESSKQQTNEYRVLLTGVKTITLHHDEQTKGRRTDPIPQLKCIGGSAKGKYKPNVIQCYNQGTDGRDVQWKCEDDSMPVEYKFGKIEIVCEGYDNPEDNYILAGSCGMEYELYNVKEPMSTTELVILLTILLLILLLIIWWVHKQSNDSANHRDGRDRESFHHHSHYYDSLSLSKSVHSITRLASAYGRTRLR